MRWTWIDRFVTFESGKAATAVKNLSLAEDHFADHFPGFPVMPAPLILEGLAQTGGILVGEARQYRENVVLAKMSNVRCHRDALAGEQLTYTATLLDLNDTGGRVAATAHSGPDLVLEAEILFAHAHPSQLPPGLSDTKFVFSGELTHLLRMAAAVSKPTEPGPAPAK
ncbi:MAG: beta-hydroxyacyl-ACP dehydratase [Gemmataceae bacterium]|nr:beta-hydroxyacyl-ACP dehydratase [Gemmataceae bacterium]